MTAPITNKLSRTALRRTSSFMSLCFALLTVAAQAQQPPQPGLTREAIEKALTIQLPEDPATVIAVVGESQILYGDLKPRVDARIQQVLDQTQQEVPEEQIKFARINLTRGLLAQTVSTKRLREKFILDQVGTQDAEKRKEASDLMASRARQLFFESEVPTMMEKLKASTRIELDDKLRAEGSSLQARQRNFMDLMLGHMYMRSAVEKQPKVTIAEIASYYKDHNEEYQHKAQARWEQLSVYYDRFPSKEAAQQAINAMAREAYFGGNLQAVAKSKSQEPLASSGGLHEWTSQGSLASDAMDKQIFSIPLNKMSDLIYDDIGIHVIRVLERKSAGVTPIAELQEKIKTTIQNEKVRVQQEKVMKDVVDSVPVWTLFPEDVPGSKPLPTKQ